MAGSDRRTGIDGVQLRQLGVCLRLRLLGGGDQGLRGDGVSLCGIEFGLGVIDGLGCILLALLCLCELRGKTGEDVEVRLCVLEIGLGAGELVGGNAGVGLCGIDGTLGIREGTCGAVRLLLGGGEDGRLLGLIGCRRVMDALCCIERLLGVGDVLEELREVGVRIVHALLLGSGVRLGGVQLGLCGCYGCVGGIKGYLLPLDGRLCRIDCRVGGIEIRFRRIQLGLGIRDTLLLGGDISLGGIDGTLGIGDALLCGIDTCLCGIRCVLLPLDGCCGAGACLLLGCEIGLGYVECALSFLETVDVGGQLLLVLVDGDGSGIPTRTGPTAVLQRERERQTGVIVQTASHDSIVRVDDVHVMTDTVVIELVLVGIPEVVGVLSGKIRRTKGGCSLVKQILFLIDPGLAGIAIAPGKVFTDIELLGMLYIFRRIVCICDRCRNELITYLKLGKADGLAVGVHVLHDRDGQKHVVEARRIKAVPNLGVVLVRAVLDDLDG